jgi:UDP-2-acetamido-2-deoxy-ribo-hexuluronate aminotransferase
VKNRDILQQKLKESGIPTSVFYPIPLHFQECFRYLNYKQNDFPISEKASKEVVSLPMNSFLTNEQINYIISSTKENL